MRESAIHNLLNSLKGVKYKFAEVDCDRYNNLYEFTGEYIGDSLIAINLTKNKREHFKISELVGDFNIRPH